MHYPCKFDIFDFLFDYERNFLFLFWPIFAILTLHFFVGFYSERIADDFALMLKIDLGELAYFAIF